MTVTVRPKVSQILTAAFEGIARIYFTGVIGCQHYLSNKHSKPIATTIMISVPFQKPVHIALPVVYRYMESQYIDKFFNEGILRVSSFKRFVNYPDEIRGDRSEGSGAFKANSGGFQVLAMTNVGHDAYILCTSLVESNELKSTFDVAECLKIINPLGFSNAIMNAIPGTTQSFLGFCNYQEHRVVQKTIEGLSVNDFTNDEGELIIGGETFWQRNQELVGNGTDLLFLKERKYQNQVEFRFVWTVNTAFFDVPNYLDIVCKEAIQFCERSPTGN
ncbi:MAG: hypothetical protein EOO15_14225 [Chitinophagaceae bacterium]|nr:MAG: hypothetical protein EOO15_14225 [Chitinophagaceae bacterium]